MRTETFSTPGPVELTIGIPAGDVDIQTGDGDETAVELEVRGRDAEELERDARIELRPRGEGFEVVVEADGNRGLFRSRDGEYRVRIHAPDGATVRAELASADISGRGRYTAVDVDVASGDLQFEEIAGEAKVDSASGDVQLGQVGSAKVNTASGDVQIDRAEGRVDVNTASGDVEVRSAAEGQVKVNSASGDVEVGIAKGSRLFVDAQSLSGGTSSDLELESGAPIDADEGPLVELRVVTMSGDVSVRRA
ncbi:MAG: DUF4097 family beta strand repeat protein [Actinobacteria bacterium]|nr:DUF4097 family beta strand repeat protein [Actinomycetota bacterium]